MVAAAWAIPIAWIAVALLSGPSDGTMISPSGAMLGADRWGESVTVVRTYGDTPLREGDVISRVDDVPIGEWVAGRPASSRAVGDVVRYEVLRPGAELDQRRVIAVPLIRYPVADAAYHNIVTLALFAMLLSAASLAYWRRPRLPRGRGVSPRRSLVTALSTSWPFGLGAIDLAGSRGIWPHLVGEAVCALGIGTSCSRRWCSCRSRRDSGADGPPPLRTPSPWRATPRGCCSSPSGWSLPQPASRA